MLFTFNTNITKNWFNRIDIEFLRKSERVVISTAGWHTDKILKMAKRFPKIGVRVSLEGMEEINNDLRGRDTGFQRGLKTLNFLKLPIFREL